MTRYPLNLLPKESFKNIQFDHVAEIRLLLVRVTSNKNILDENGQIHSEHICIQTDHLKDYSTNLFGVYNEEHVAIEWLKTDNVKSSDFFDIWENRSICQEPILNVHFCINQEQGLFFLKTSDFHNKEVKHTTSQDIFSSKVIHTPTKSNFWHCSIRWYINGVDSVEKTKSQRRSIHTIARTMISIKGKTEINISDYSVLSPEYYTL